jgi:hypothetical protein
MAFLRLKPETDHWEGPLGLWAAVRPMGKTADSLEIST